MRFENYIKETTVASDIKPNTTKGNIRVIGRGANIIKSATGDNNLRVDLIELIDNKYQVIVHMLKDDKWIVHSIYDFDEKEHALDKYNKIVEEF